MKKFREYAYVYLIGAALYGCFEVAVRGFTHWSMFLTGGLAFLLLYRFNLKAGTASITLRCLAGSGIITSLEFSVGCLVNRTLGWHIWDYSARSGHILGQICPMFSIVWFLLSLPVIPMSFYIRKKLFSDGKRADPPFRFVWFFTPLNRSETHRLPTPCRIKKLCLQPFRPDRRKNHPFLFIISHLCTDNNQKVHSEKQSE